MSALILVPSLDAIPDGVSPRACMTLDELRSMVSYDPETGGFTWIKQLRWKNKSIKVGDIISTKNSSGYVAIRIRGYLIPAHRVGYAFFHNTIDFGDLDHVNRVKDDNRIRNLREAGAWRNAANNPKCVTNTSGFRGVTYDERYGNFRARLSFDNTSVFLGTYPTAEEAGFAYDIAALHYRGEFAGQLNFPAIHRLAAKLAMDGEPSVHLFAPVHPNAAVASASLRTTELRDIASTNQGQIGHDRRRV